MRIGNLMSSHSLSAGHVPLGLGRDIIVAVRFLDFEEMEFVKFFGLISSRIY